MSRSQRPHDADDVPLDCRVEACGPTRILFAVGEIDLSTVWQLEAALRWAFADHPPVLLMDLSGVTFMDSSAVHAIHQAQVWAAMTDVELVVLPVDERVSRPFRRAGFDYLLSFGQSPPPGGG